MEKSNQVGITMEKDLPKSPQRKSVQVKTVKVQKCTFATKVGYMDVILLACGLSVGLVYLGMRATSSLPTALDKLVKEKKDDFKENAALGITLLIAFSFVGVFTTFHLIVARELLATSPKPDINETLKLLWMCKTYNLVLMGVDLVGILLGYPDVKICAFLTLFAALLLVVFMSIMVVESAYKIEFYAKEEKRILEEEAKKLGLLVSVDKIETV